MQLINVPLDRIRPNPWQTRLRLEHTHVLPLAVDIFRNGLMHPPAGRLLNAGGNIVLLDSFNTSLAEGVAMILAEGGYIQLAIGHNRAAAYDVLAYGPSHRFPELEDYLESDMVTDPGRYGHLPMQLAEYTDQQMATMAWSENAQRKDLTPLEEARAIYKAINDFGWTQAEAAEHFGLARATVANKLRLLQLPEEVGTQLHAGAISERAAGALLPLYNLPDRVRQTIVEQPQNSYFTEENIVQEAAKGASSDQLRNMVNNAIRRATVQHNGVHFPLDVQVADGHSDVHAAKCTECPLLLRHGDENRCGDGDCYDIKADSWKAYRLSIAGEHMPPLTAADRWSLQFFEDGNYRQYYDMGKQIVAEGCDKLRTCYYPELLHSNRKVVHVGAMPDLPIVCSAGNNCACLARLEKAASEPDPKEIAENEAKERWTRDVRQPLAQRLATALEAMDQNAWRIIAQSAFHSLRNDSDMQWQSFCAKAAELAVRGREPWKPHEAFETTRNDLQQWLADAGIKDHTPAEDPATDLRRRLERIKVWAHGLVENYPTVEQVRGNLDNLDKLVADLWEMTPVLAPSGQPGDHEKSDPLDYFLAEVESLQGLLQDLLRIVDDEQLLLVDFYEYMPVLMSTAPAELDALLANSPMPTALLQYALALAYYQEDLERHGALSVLLSPAFNTCDDCGDDLQADELISCSCIGLYCENCYDQNGHRTHDSNTDNAALSEIIEKMNNETL